MSIINSDIINKTGLACIIWNDATPEVLRKRLDQKVERKTLLPEEKQKILQTIEQLHLQAKKEFETIIIE